MIKVTKAKPYKVKKAITQFPCIVTAGCNMFLVLQLKDKEQADNYYSYERDAVCLGPHEVGKFIKALNLEECELYEGKVTLENETI